jgi:hypothetical protein
MMGSPWPHAPGTLFEGMFHGNKKPPRADPSFLPPPPSSNLNRQAETSQTIKHTSLTRIRLPFLSRLVFSGLRVLLITLTKLLGLLQIGDILCLNRTVEQTGLSLLRKVVLLCRLLDRQGLGVRK